jgi:hypothetical protein
LFIKQGAFYVEDNLSTLTQHPYESFLEQRKKLAVPNVLTKKIIKNRLSNKGGEESAKNACAFKPLVDLSCFSFTCYES